MIILSTDINTVNIYIYILINLVKLVVVYLVWSEGSSTLSFEARHAVTILSSSTNNDGAGRWATGWTLKGGR
jgi:hypothetical protein